MLIVYIIKYALFHNLNSVLFTVFCIGLLDADDPDDFRARLSSVKDVWDQREQEYLPRGTKPKFHDYILNRVSGKRTLESLLICKYIYIYIVYLKQLVTNFATQCFTPEGDHQANEYSYTIYIYMYRLSYERRGNISFIARETISYFVTSERSERGTKYDIVSRAIKLILPSLECDNLFITYLCLYLEQKPDYIFKLLLLRVHFKMNSKLLFKIR